MSDKARLCMSEEKGIACKRRDQRSFETIDTSHRESMVLSPPSESTGTIAERSLKRLILSPRRTVSKNCPKTDKKKHGGNDKYFSGSIGSIVRNTKIKLINSSALKKGTIVLLTHANEQKLLRLRSYMNLR